MTDKVDDTDQIVAEHEAASPAPKPAPAPAPQPLVNPEPGLPLTGPGADDAAARMSAVREHAGIEKDQPLPPIYRSMAEARAAGHSWENINNYIADGREKAIKAGYTNDDINKLFLGVPLNGYITAPTLRGDENLPTEVGAKVRQFTETYIGLHNPYAAMDLPEPGADFTAGGILKNLGWGVADVAKTFGSTILNGAAATAEMFDGKQRTAWEWGKQLYEASGFLAMFIRAPAEAKPVAGHAPEPVAPRGLPQMQDFLDAATSIAQKHPEGLTERTLATSLRDLGEHYVATREHPIDTAANAATHEDFTNKIAAAKAYADFDKATGYRGQDNSPNPGGTSWSSPEAMARWREENPLQAQHGDVMAARRADEILKDTLAAQDRVVPPERASKPQPVEPTTFEKMIADESGRIPLAPRDDIQPETLFQHDPEVASGIMREIKSFFSPSSLAPNAAEAIRYRLAQSTFETERSIGALQRYGRAVGELSTPERMGLIDAIESGDKAHPNYPGEGTPLRGLVNQLRKELDAAHERMAKAGVAPDYVENYLPHMYADPVGAKKWLQTRSPIAGGKSFTKARVFGSYAEAREAGYVAATDNPVTMSTLALRQMNKYVAAHRVVEDFRKADIIKSMRPADVPPGDFERINGRLGVTGEGDLYAPADVARLINNITDPGLSNKSWYRVVRTMSNDLIRMQLAGPGFHASFITLDTTSSQMSLAAKQLSRVFLNAPSTATAMEGVQALKTLATTPIAPIKNYIAGRQVIDYLKGHLAEDKTTPLIRQIGEAVTQGGGRLGITEDYRGSAYGSFLNAFKGTFQPSSGFATLGQEIAQTIRDAQPVKAWGRTIVPGVAKAAYQLLGRTMDTIAAPLMDHYVPTMKVGTFSMLMQDALRVHPEMGELEMRHVAATIWNSMDNRMGEMVYDNTFWNKTHKDIAHIAVRALGWNAGDIRELPGGVINLARGKTEKIGDMRSIMENSSYVVGLPATVALLGAVSGVAMGTWHEGWKIVDYFNPPTPGGSRIILPSYMKDIENVFHKPGEVVTSKLNPMFPMMKSMFTNRDWYGGVIADTRNEDTITNVEDYAQWFAKQYMPISLQQALHPNAAQSEIPPAFRLLGITPAPYQIREPEKTEKFENKDYKGAVKKREKERAKEAQ